MKIPKEFPTVECDLCRGSGWRDRTGPCGKCYGAGRVVIAEDKTAGPRLMLIAFCIAGVITIAVLVLAALR